MKLSSPSFGECLAAVLKISVNRMELILPVHPYMLLQNDGKKNHL